MTVSTLLNTLASGKMIKHATVLDAVAFQVVNSDEGDSAKGDHVGQWGGAISPLLHWTTKYIEQKEKRQT